MQSCRPEPSVNVCTGAPDSPETSVVYPPQVPIESSDVSGWRVNNSDRDDVPGSGVYVPTNYQWRGLQGLGAGTVLMLTRNAFFIASKIADKFSIVGLPDLESMRCRLLLGFFTLSADVSNPIAAFRVFRLAYPTAIQLSGYRTDIAGALVALEFIRYRDGYRVGVRDFSTRFLHPRFIR